MGINLKNSIKKIKTIYFVKFNSKIYIKYSNLFEARFRSNVRNKAYKIPFPFTTLYRQRKQQYTFSDDKKNIAYLIIFK